MRLWIEHATQAFIPPGADECGAATSTLQTEDLFCAVLAGGGAPARERAAHAARIAASVLGGQESASDPEDLLEIAAAQVLATLPGGQHSPTSVLCVRGGHRASLVEIDAPPLFMARRGSCVVLPLLEEETDGRLVRRCCFSLQDGDHLAMASEDYIRTRAGGRPWSWREVATSIRRLTETRCNAEQLAGALIRSYQRLAGKEAGDREPVLDRATSNQQPVTVLAMFVRSMRTVAVWSGPPADGGRDREALARLLAEEGTRVICGDTTAEIAARLLGAELRIDPPPPEGWTEVPPTSRLVGTAERIDLITEGAVTLDVARQRLAEAGRPGDLAGRSDGASRLARLLVGADRVLFLVGSALNPAQTAADGTPLRRLALDALVRALEEQGKIVAVEPA